MGFLDGLFGTDAAPDLSGWAAGHGLDFHDRRRVVGYGFTLKPDWPDAARNVISGRLPGGEEGVLFHNVGRRALRRTATRSTNAPIQFTRVGTFVGEAIAPLQRFRVSADPEVQAGWSAPEVGLQRTFACSANADMDAVRHVLAAGLGERFDALPADVTPNYRFGVLSFAVDGLCAPARLEVLCEELAVCARLLRASVPTGDPRRLEHELPAPFWIAASDSGGREIAPATPYPVTADVEGTGLDQPLTLGWMQLATALGTTFADARLAPEDTLSFYRSFPRFPVPGQAVLVARGTLPGTTLPGRVVFLADNYPDSFNRGFDAVVVAATSAPDTLGPHEQSGGVRFAVRDGWASVWRPRADSRDPSQVDPHAYATLAAEAAALAATRGWT